MTDAALKTEALPAEAWLKEIDRALTREKEWRDRGRKVVQRYRDRRSRTSTVDGRINILWSNTEVKRAALYSRTAVPDIRRRFPDAKGGDKVARMAAEVLERALTYCIDTYDVDAAMSDVVLDRQLPGRGTIWLEYEPTIKGEAIVDQKVWGEFVYWEDFCHGNARTWGQVPWVARRHALSKSEFETKFPDAKVSPDFDYQLKTADDDADQNDRFVECWQVWDKPSKSRIYVARGVVNELQRDVDPYHLDGFFPLPAPLYSVMTTDRLIPEPEFCQYQDQADELDRVSQRIRRLLEQLVWKGIYDGAIDGENTLSTLAGASDGEFIPYANWAVLKDKGGIEAAVGFWPIERIVGVLQQLFPRVEMLIQEIYQITGISDIMRGSTDPNETKGAQQLKAQFGSMRIQREQRDVQRFVRDFYRLKAEMIAEHFTQEMLAQITNIDLPSNAERDQARVQTQMLSQSPQMGHNGGPPMEGGMMPAGPMPPPDMPPQPPPIPPEVQEMAEAVTWDDVMEILRSDKLRRYRVDIETDSTILVDAEAEKKGRIELVTAVQGLLSGAFQMITAAPSTIPLIEEVVMFALRSFKPGRALEEAFEEAFQALKDSPPQPEQKDQPASDVPPDKSGEIKAMAAVEDVKRKAARDQAEMQIEARKAGQDAQNAQADRLREDALAQATIEATQIGAVVDMVKAKAQAAAAAQRANTSPARGQ